MNSENKGNPTAKDESHILCQTCQNSVSYDLPPLFNAVFKNCFNDVRLLLQSKTNHTVKNSAGWTPLHFAARNGYGKIVSSLLEHGAYTDIQSNELWTPLHLSLLNGFTSITQHLLSYNASIDCKTITQWTPFHIAASKNIQSFEQLICNGFFLPAPDRTEISIFYGKEIKEYGNKASLKELSLCLFLDALKEQPDEYIYKSFQNILFLGDWMYEIIAEREPLCFQRQFYTFLLERDHNMPLKALLTAHCERHLDYLHAILDQKTETGESVYDVGEQNLKRWLSNPCATSRIISERKSIITFLEKIKQARTFDELEDKLKNPIIKMIREKLTFVSPL